jgi:acetyltransferase-like isoleucine patch superfamily enzyme
MENILASMNKFFLKVLKNIKLGKNVKISPFTNIYGCELKDNVFIGPFVEVQKNVTIGENSRVQSHSFICEGVDIGKNVFIGHNVNTINDNLPKVNNENWVVEKIIIRDNVSIGTGSTIMGNVTIGENSIIGANSLVTTDIPYNEVWIGSPAKFLRKI